MATAVTSEQKKARRCDHPQQGWSQDQIQNQPPSIPSEKLSKSGQYAAKKAEHAKSSVRAKVEHVFGVVKKQLRFRKHDTEGLEKQRAKFNIMFALAEI